MTWNQPLSDEVWYYRGRNPSLVLLGYYHERTDLFEIEPLHREHDNWGAPPYQISVGTLMHGWTYFAQAPNTCPLCGEAAYDTFVNLQSSAPYWPSSATLSASDLDMTAQRCLNHPSYHLSLAPCNYLGITIQLTGLEPSHWVNALRALVNTYSRITTLSPLTTVVETSPEVQIEMSRAMGGPVVGIGCANLVVHPGYPRHQARVLDLNPAHVTVGHLVQADLDVLPLTEGIPIPVGPLTSPPGVFLGSIPNLWVRLKEGKL
jgi:hypothetical protein